MPSVSTPFQTPQSCLVSRQLLKCMYTNTQNLPNKLFELRDLANTNKFSLIGLTETWLSDQYTDSELSLPNMSLLRTDRNSKGGGVALYFSSDLCVYKLPCFSSPDAIWCKIRLTHTHTCLLAVIYRPPNNSESSDNVLLQDLDRFLSLTHTHILIMGDFNCPSLLHRTHPVGSFPYQFRTLLENVPLYNHVTEPTRFRQCNVPSILDLIITNDELMIESVQYLPPLGASDHCCLYFDFVCFASSPMDSNHLCLRTDYNLLRDLIKDTNLLPNDSCDPEVVWHYFSTTLKNLQDMATSLRSVRKPALQNFLRSRTRKFLCMRNRHWIAYCTNPSSDSWESYRLLRNHCVSLIRQDKLIHQSRLAQRFSTNRKFLYQYVNSIRTVQPGVTALNTMEGTATTPADVAEVLRKQFTSVFSAPSTFTPLLSTVHESPPLSTVNFSPDIVYNKLRTINVYKSPGPDGFRPRMLRECAHELAYPLATLFTYCLVAGTVPREWKRGIISPIHKNGERSDPANYRPVTLLSVISKIMESIIADAVYSYIENLNLFGPNQHGFRKSYSCVTNLLTARNDWTRAVDSRHDVHIIFLDFSKAFDKVDHCLLVSKLHSFGIRGNLLSWFLSYLSQRYVQVRVRGWLSDLQQVTSGVPQGSVLGPLLFNIFICDLATNISSPMIHYADDTKLWREIQCPEDELVLQQDLNKYYVWTVENKLPLNTGKCKMMSLFMSTLSYHIGSTVLQQVSQERDLGVVIQSSLSVSATCVQASKHALSALGLLRRALGTFEPITFKILLHSYIRPHLEYAIEAWSPWLRKDQRILERPQRRATKFVRGLWYRSYSERLARLGIHSTLYRRIRSDLIFTYKALTTPNHPCRSLFMLSKSTFLRGHPFKLEHQRCRLNCRKNFLSLRVTRLWNTLPLKVVTASSIAQFKANLDIFLSNKRFDMP